MEPKIQFKVSGRLSIKDKFIELEVKSKFFNLGEAQNRMQEWLRSMGDLPKSKPEAHIETEELPHLADCFKCGSPLFKDDMVFHSRVGKCCHDCVCDPPLIDGYYDLLDLENNSQDSLDMLGGI